MCYIYVFPPQSLGQVGTVYMIEWGGHWLKIAYLSDVCSLYSLMGGTMSALSLYFEYQANTFEKPKGTSKYLLPLLTMAMV